MLDRIENVFHSFTVDQGLVNKRFTLKPPTLLLRPVSPPNSSNDVIEIATNNHENEDTICDCGDSSSTSMSAGSSSHSNSKVSANLGQVKEICTVARHAIFCTGKLLIYLCINLAN